jgi:L-alanine-DL-glutamate epimerase-like enolase superfamily enzyme
MNFRLLSLRFFTVPTRTRFPFQYGIASMTSAPHVIVRAEIECPGGVFGGQSAEGLPPKWFTKNPTTRFEEDLPEMVRVIESAAEIARNFRKTASFFDHWRHLFQEHRQWAARAAIAPLLANLGVSLVERAMLDAFCRAAGQPLHALLRANALEIDIGSIREELRGVEPRDFLPQAPTSSLAVRHTVGLGDPIDASDAVERPADDLPFTLQENIAACGLTFFKIKLSGDFARDSARLSRLAEALPSKARFSVDGNENFAGIAAFREQWERHLAHPRTGDWLRRGLIFVEQPVHRASALSADAGRELSGWSGAPDIIIDEADGSLEDLPHALALGYRGVSHKNCKGIIKGLANAALLRVKSAESPRAAPFILSGEDLANIGPVALLQDCAMMAALGLQDAERNGHHYFRGLSMWPERMQSEMAQSHSDLYAMHAGSPPYAALQVRDGMIRLDSVNAAPFGCRPLWEVTMLPEGLPTQWKADS